MEEYSRLAPETSGQLCYVFIISALSAVVLEEFFYLVII